MYIYKFLLVFHSLYQVHVPNSIFGVLCPSSADYALLSAASVMGVAQFFWARPQQGKHMLKEAEALAKEEKDLFGEPKFADKSPKKKDKK